MLDESYDKTRISEAPLESKNEEYANIELLISLNRIIFNLKVENLELSVQQTISLFDINFPLSFNFIICKLIYFAFSAQKNEFDIYLNYFEILQAKEEQIINMNSKITDIFLECIIKFYSKESFYLIEKLIEKNLIDINVIDEMKTNYFAHHRKENNPIHDNYFIEFFANYEQLSKNDWELHKKYIEEGINQNEIAQIIRNDEIDKLQEISSQTNFDFNQRIKPSLYERCSFIDQRDVTLIDYAAFFGSVQCFKYLLLNGSKLDNVGKYAITGENPEIIHLCEQNHASFEGAHEAAIMFHKNDIFRYIYENELEGNKIRFTLVDEKYNDNKMLTNELKLIGLAKVCILCYNFELLSYIEKENLKINDSVINYAAKTGNLFLVKYFLQKCQVPKNILCFSSESDNFELVEYVLQHIEIDINAQNNQGDTALMILAKNNNIKTIKLLLQHKGIDLNLFNNEGENLLILSSSNGNTEIVKLLLEYEGIKVNNKDWNGNTALISASSGGHTEIVKLLLEQKGIEVNTKNKNGNTALIYASSGGHTEIVKLLLEQEGIDVNAKNKGGKTALMKASLNGHTEIAKLLLEQKGIDINGKDKWGETPLILATINNYIEIVKLLLEKEGIDVNSINDNKWSALIFSCHRGFQEIVKLLLEQEQINVNLHDMYGNTALIYASENGHKEVVKLLLEKKGIDVNVKNNNDETAFVKALQNNDEEIMKLLKDHEGFEIDENDGIQNNAQQ